jgi:hypothetical protein
MVFGDGIRRNIASISAEERIELRSAILKLDSDKFYPDNVSYWDKQDHIHQVNHIHGGGNFLPFYRNLLNKFEELLREIHPKLSLHYWDYNTDPRNIPIETGEKINLFTTGEDGFMGNAKGGIGSPLDQLTNKGEFIGSREQTKNPMDPPQNITRDVGNRRFIRFSEDGLMLVDSIPEDQQYAIFAGDLSGITTQACDYIGGTIGGVEHKIFQDPFSFLIFSNTDRIWASWQLQKKFKKWRSDSEKIYGKLSNDHIIIDYLEPWAGGITDTSKKILPWGISGKNELKNCKDPIIIKPPKYDIYAGDVDQIVDDL